MTTDDGLLHPKFKLNGSSYTRHRLKDLAYDLIKEGSVFEKAIGNFLSDWLNDKSVLEVRTSGSTGTPKTIVLQKKQMVSSALATGEYFDLESGSRALLCLPAAYIAGKMMLVRAMVLGLDVHYVEPSSRPLTGLSEGYDFVAMVPLQLKQSLDQIELVKTLLVGGAAVSKNLKEQVQHKRTAIFESYGMTETITHVAVKKLNTEDECNRGHFKALPNITFSTDDRGCLIISAPKLADDPVVTNDLVNLVSETQFEWLGRFDNVINSGGIKLYPEQIEAKLTHLFSNRFFVAGMPDDDLGQTVVLVLEGKADPEKVFQKLKKAASLERFEFPKQVYALQQFLETDTGKIRRKENTNLLKS